MPSYQYLGPRFINNILNNILNISKFPKLWFAILCGSGLLMREALSQLCKNLEQIRFPLFISDSDFYRQHKTRNRQLRDLVLSLQSCWAHFLWLWLCPWSRVLFLGQYLLSNVYVCVILCYHTYQFLDSRATEWRYEWMASWDLVGGKLVSTASSLVDAASDSAGTS